jgi:putative flippase GtrA
MSARPIHLAERILRYALSGLSVSVAYTLLVVLLVHKLPKISPTGNAAIAFLLVQPLGLLLHGIFTYPETGRARNHLPRIGLRFVITNAGGFIVATGGMAVITSVLNDSYLWGIALAWILVPALNFVIYLVWVFKPATIPDTSKAGRYS